MFCKRSGFAFSPMQNCTNALSSLRNLPDPKRGCLVNTLEISQTGRQTCAACGTEIESPEGRVFDTRFGVGEFFAISSCPRCQLEQTVPKPSSQALKILYESYYN